MWCPPPDWQHLGGEFVAVDGVDAVGRELAVDRVGERDDLARGQVVRFDTGLGEGDVAGPDEGAIDPDSMTLGDQPNARGTIVQTWSHRRAQQ